MSVPKQVAKYKEIHDLPGWWTMVDMDGGNSGHVAWRCQSGGKEEALLDTLLRIRSDGGQEIKRDGTLTPAYTSEKME